jgi:hypothetical protein
MVELLASLGTRLAFACARAVIGLAGGNFSSSINTFRIASSGESCFYSFRQWCRRGLSKASVPTVSELPRQTGNCAYR